jgi:hypothetical protein
MSFFSKLLAKIMGKADNNPAPPSAQPAPANRDRSVSPGAKYALWTYSGTPCRLNPNKPSAKDIRQNAAHKAANGKRFNTAKGLLLNGRPTFPGQSEGCNCTSRSVIPGLNR